MSEERKEIEQNHTEVTGLFIGPNHDKGVISLALSADEDSQGLVVHMNPSQTLTIIAAMAAMLQELTDAHGERIRAAMEEADSAPRIVIPPPGALS